MSETPKDLKYSKSHEWVRVDNEEAVIGITDNAQSLLGDLVFVDLPDVGTELTAGNEAGVVESVKAASDVYSPLSGEVIAINEALNDTPELVNRDPYGDGWLYRLRLSNSSELDTLLDAAAYDAVAQEGSDH